MIHLSVSLPLMSPEIKVVSSEGVRRKTDRNQQNFLQKKAEKERAVGAEMLGLGTGHLLSSL